eukprot:TRINITY_DN2113_c0_g1_i2.p1 TRINITY_DN2113_c0_g1~~TRINITY_DN2113_c0_g1_i2.p1  ORF type:complete len:419 (+),score=57.01 TRINITY_DN2113_c0_g1_i2:16-1272(+)
MQRLEDLSLPELRGLIQRQEEEEREIQLQLNQRHHDIGFLKTIEAIVVNRSRTAEQPAFVPRRKYERVSAETSHRIVQQREAGLSASQIAADCGITQSTVYNHINKRPLPGDAESSPARKKPGPKSIFLDSENVIRCMTWLDQEPNLTLEGMKQKFAEVGIKTSKGTINRFYEDSEITWKESKCIPPSWNSPSNVALRMNYATSYFNIPGMVNKIFIDESGFQLAELCSTKGRAVKGKSTAVIVPSRSKRLNAIAALSSEGIVHVKYVTTPYKNTDGEWIRGVNATDFEAFLLELADVAPRDSILILDNARIHHALVLEGQDGVWKSISQDYGLKKMYLSPYSPWLNPIELVFNTCKAKLRGIKPTTMDSLKTELKKTFKDVTPNQAKKYFAHAEKFIEGAMKGLTFDGTILAPAVPQ